MMTYVSLGVHVPTISFTRLSRLEIPNLCHIAQPIYNSGLSLFSFTPSDSTPPASLAFLVALGIHRSFQALTRATASDDPINSVRLPRQQRGGVAAGWLPEDR